MNSPCCPSVLVVDAAHRGMHLRLRSASRHVTVRHATSRHVTARHATSRHVAKTLAKPGATTTLLTVGDVRVPTGVRLTYRVGYWPLEVDTHKYDARCVLLLACLRHCTRVGGGYLRAICSLQVFLHCH